MIKRSRIFITIYLTVIGIGGLSAISYYQWTQDYSNQKPWYDYIEINSTDVIKLKQKAVELQGQGDYKTALQYYNRILEIDPENTEVMGRKTEINNRFFSGN